MQGQATAVVETENQTVDLPKAVEDAWEAVFKTTNTVITAHSSFGFTQLEAKINPNLNHLLMGLKVVESVLDTVYASELIEYDEKRLILNAKQQIGLIQRVAEALKNENKADYDSAIKALTDQAQF